MNKIVQLVTSKLSRPTLLLKKHSPVILFGAGVVGVGTTVVLACRATLKLEETLEETKTDLARVERASEREDFDDDQTKRAQVAIYVSGGLKVAKLYAPAVAVGLVSVGALTGAHVLLNKRVAGLGAAYAAVDTAFKKYRQRVAEELGIEKDLEFQQDFEDREYVVEGPEGPEVKTIRQPGPGAPSMYARFFDENNKNFKRDPHHNQFFIQCQQNWANDMLKARGHVFLNEIYDMLGFDRTKAGAVVGWVWNGKGDSFIDFGVLEGDRYTGQRFINGEERSIRLDFNVAGVIYDLLKD